MNFLKRKIRLWLLNIVFGNKLKELCIEKVKSGYIIEITKEKKGIEAFLLNKEYYTKIEMVSILRKV